MARVVIGARKHVSLIRKHYWQPKEVLKAFFCRNPILRHHHKHFLRIGVTAFKHDGLPMWQQETCQAFEDYLKERTLLRPGDPSSS